MTSSKNHGGRHRWIGLHRWVDKIDGQIDRQTDRYKDRGGELVTKDK